MMQEDGVKKFIRVDVTFHQGLNLALFKELDTFLGHCIFFWGMDNAILLCTGDGLEYVPNTLFIPDKNGIDIAGRCRLAGAFQHMPLIRIDHGDGHGGQALDRFKHVLECGKFNTHTLSPCLLFRSNARVCRAIIRSSLVGITRTLQGLVVVEMMPALASLPLGSR